MLCPECGGDTKVIDTQHNLDGTRVIRRRRCLKCRYGFQTVEAAAGSLEYGKVAELLNMSIRAIDDLKQLSDSLSKNILPECSEELKTTLDGLNYRSILTKRRRD